MTKLYDLENQVEATINILNNVIKFIQTNNLMEERENSFNIIKDNYQTLTTHDVDLLNFNFKKLARSVSSLIHPDRFPKDQDLIDKANELLQSFNGSIDSVAKNVSKALADGQTTYLWHSNKTNNAEKEYQRAYEKEKNQYQKEYGSRRRRSNHTEDQSQRNSGAYEENYRGQNYNDFRNTNRSQSRGFRYYSAEAESYDEDSWIKTQATQAYEYVRSRFNFIIKKVPSTEKDYVTLKVLYEEKIRSLEYKINATESKIQSLNNKYSQVIVEKEHYCSHNNIEAEYARELQKITINKQNVSEELNLLNSNINRRINDLMPLINEEYRAYQSYRDQMINLYEQEKQMASRGMTRLLNIPKGMSTDDYFFKKYNQIINNPPQNEIVNIRNEILKRDPQYRYLEERIVTINKKYKELENRINYYVQNANEIKNGKYKKYQKKYLALEKSILDERDLEKNALKDLKTELSYSNWRYDDFQEQYGYLANAEGAKRR